MSKHSAAVLAGIAGRARKEGDTYRVLSKDGEREYRVTPDSCTCPARENYPGPCKHMEAVSLLCPPVPEERREPVIRRFIILRDGIWCDTYYAWTKEGLDKAERDRDLMQRMYPQFKYEVSCWQLPKIGYEKLPMPKREELP